MSLSRNRTRASGFLDWNRIRSLSYPLAVTIGIRAIGAVLVFQTLSSSGSFHTPWMDANADLMPASSNWLWLFNAWDSLQFPLIAMFGYHHPQYVYLPGYPILIGLTGLLTGNFWFGAFLVTQIFALASIVMFQLLAEQYMGPQEALHATFLMAAFPFVSVFSTLSYSESVFLFFSLSTWYFHKKNHFLTSSILAGITSVTRIYGFAILLPMLLDNIKTKRYRNLLHLAIPGVFMAGWLLFCYFSTGDILASWTDEKYWMQAMTLPNGDSIRLVQAVLSQGLRGILLCCSGLDPTIFWSVGLFAILIAMTWKIDRALWAYTVILSSLLFFTAPYYISLLRFFAFIFPVWLAVKVRNSLVVAICVASFVPLILIVWLFTIAVTFVG